MIGHPNSHVLRGTLASIRAHSLPHQILSSQELKEKYPVLTPDEETIGVFETEAGYLIPEACIASYCQHAQQNGAELHFNESLISWRSIPSTIFQFPTLPNNSPNQQQQQQQFENESELIEVTTTLSKYITKKLVLTVGAWAPEIYGSSLPFKLRIERRVLYWIHPSNSEYLETFKVI